MEAPEDGRRPLEILLVEDNPGDARLFGELLAEGELDAGHRWERSLEEGLAAVRGDDFDLVVVDLDLPDSRGLESVRRISDAVEDRPIVVMTGLAELDTATEALGIGASECLRKDGLTAALLARTLRMARERHRLQGEADRQHALSRTILDSLAEHVALVAEDGTVEVVNRAWRRFAAREGGDPRGYAGDDYLEVTRDAAEGGDEDARAILAGLEAVLAGERDRFVHEYPCYGPDTRRWFRLEATPFRAAGGRGAVVSHVDVTERVERERELEATTRALRERVKEQTCLHDVVRLLHADDGALDDRLQAVVDRMPDGWQHPEATAVRLRLGKEVRTSPGFREAGPSLEATIEVGGRVAGEIEVVCLEERPEADLGPFLREEQELLEAVAREVAATVERRRTRRELEAERSRLAEVFRHAPAWIATLRGPDHVFEMANPAYRELVGERDLEGRPVREVFPELEGEGFYELLDRVYERGETVEAEEAALPLETEQGRQTRHISFVFQPRREDGEVVGVIAHGVDVTEQVERREEARQAEEKWATALELAPVGIVISEPDSGRLHSVNEAFEEIFGATQEELLGRSSLEMDQWVDPDRRREIVDRAKAEGMVEEAEADFRRADGRTGRMRVSCRMLELAGEERLLWTVRDVTAERERAERLSLLESAVHATDHGLVIADRGGRIVWANPAFEKMTGYALDEAIGESLAILEPEEGSAVEEEVRDAVLAGRSWEGEAMSRRKDGTRYVERQTVVPVRHDSDEVTHFIALKTDVTVEKEREAALRESEARYRTLVETMAEATVTLDREGRITFANAEAEGLLGLEASELTGRIYDDPEWRITASGGGPFPSSELPFRRVMRTGRPVRDVEHAIQTPEGERHILSVNAAPLAPGEDGPGGVVATIRDVTERKRLERQLEHQALHDPLTGLANRTLFRDRLGQALARSRRAGESMGLILLDVDGFKRVNDNLGHTAGDQVLVELARRFQSVVRDSDTVSRWGGDEFAVILPELDAPEAVESLQGRLRQQVERPVEAGGELLELGVTAGLVVRARERGLGTVDTETPEELVRFADIALHRAKDRRAGGFYRFDPDDELTEVPDLRLEQDLRRGLEAGEIEVFYQPVWRLTDGSLWGFEALARWRHSERGLVSPGEFVPLAERVGLIGQIGAEVNRTGCGQLARWRRGREEAAGAMIAFNLSARELQDPEIVDRIRACLEEAGLPADRVVVEVTETAVMKGVGQVEALQALGIQLYIDDFGTGYSTYTYLRDLDLQGLKIDMSFVQGLPHSTSDAAIVESMMTLGRRFGLEVIAEGIETEEQLAALREFGCTLGQGFHLGRPVPAVEAEEAFEGR